MNYVRTAIIGALFLACKANANDLLNLSTIADWDSTHPNKVLDCIVRTGLNAVFPEGREIVASPFASPVGDGLGPETMALVFVDRDKLDHRGVHEIHLRSTDQLKHWQIYQQNSEIGYFSTSVSTEAEIYVQDAAHLLKKFDISACR